jgi:hypothetical protein
MHGGSVLAPLWEFVGVRGHFVPEALDDCWIFVEENLAIQSANESCDLNS